MRVWKAAPVALLTGLLGLACTGGVDGPTLVEPAKAALDDGDLPAAYSEYDKAFTENPDVKEAGLGAAYAYLLAGEYEKADNALSNLEKGAEPDELSNIKLRRAMVALAQDDFDAVKTHGSASGTPQGLVLAAEVHLADAESEDAITLLKKAESDAVGPVKRTAKKYLEMLESGDQFQSGLAEATALWALGHRGEACEAAEELVKGLETEDKGEQILLWSGRAVTSDHVDIAASLLDEIEAEMVEIPQEHRWREGATKAMVMVAQGEGEAAIALLDGLQASGAPADGLEDARATAAALATDKSIAKRLVEGLESAAAGRSLSQAGAGKAAKDQTPAGALKQYLEGK